MLKESHTEFIIRLKTVEAVRIRQRIFYWRAVVVLQRPDGEQQSENDCCQDEKGDTESNPAQALFRSSWAELLMCFVSIILVAASKAISKQMYRLVVGVGLHNGLYTTIV